MVMAPATATLARGGGSEREHLGRDGALSMRWVGVGHGHHRGEPAERSGACPGLDALGVLVARLA